jgi:phage baseplate assembly protein W
MGLLIQVSPFTGSVVAAYSDNFSTTLQVTGGTGQLTFVTTNPSGSLTVNPDGFVTTNGLLGAGPFSVSGTVTDVSGNAGVWLFNLTVLPLSPETSVIPVVPSPPSPGGVEIVTPFQFDPATGGVASTVNYALILEQHIKSIILTSQLARVMLPFYGAGLEQQVFSGIDDTLDAIILADITLQVSQWESAVNIINVQVTPTPGQDSTITVLVTFSIVPFNTVNTITVTTGGTVSQEISV